MMELINNPVGNTYIFIVILVLAMALSARWKKNKEPFPPELTQELKGFAILAIVFSHIGYFLFYDHRFLFPLSVLAGVGVDLFLFVSGYGLTISSLNKKYSIWQFYKRRLVRLFVPMWIVIAVFFLLDFFILKIIYPWSYIATSFAGIFGSANLYNDINSPLWYFTLILLYYLVFPLIFFKKRPWLSALFIYVVSWLILIMNPVWLNQIMSLYQVHIIAFPLGMFFAWLFYRPYFFVDLIPAKTISYLNNIKNHPRVVGLRDKFRQPDVLDRLKKYLGAPIYYLIFILAVFIFCYLAIYSGVGKGINIEQWTSIVTVLVIIFIFLLKKIEFRFFYIFGIYSYEIYLLHWPIVYHYDIFYKYLPAWLATSLYLALFLGLSWGLQKLSKMITRRIK